MILTLAFRNLFHDRIRLAVTLIGILFSIVLVAVQLGLYLGASRMITTMIDQSNRELWITAFGAKSFEEGGVLLGPGSATRRSQRRASKLSFRLSSPSPNGASRQAARRGSCSSARMPRTAVSSPTIWSGHARGHQRDRTASRRTVTYFSWLGIEGDGSAPPQVANGRVRVRALTKGLRSFTQSPYTFTTLTRARNLLGVDGEKSSFYLVQLEPGSEARRSARHLLSNRSKAPRSSRRTSSAPRASSSGCSGPAPAWR